MAKSRDHVAPCRVLILMAVYNGERFLDEQLRSIESQSFATIDMLVSDDGSRDGSPALLELWRKRWNKGEFRIIDGPRAGFAANFRHLMLNAGDPPNYVAFADQDDIWDQDKIERQVNRLRLIGSGRPALSCGRTRTMTDDGSFTGMSPRFSRPPCFRNAIVQSIAGANTMVLNDVAFRVVAETARRSPFVSHDWWSYLIVSGAGGVVDYTTEPAISYRQHEGNLVGANNSLRARLQRMRAALFSNRFSDWNSRNLQGLSICRDLLTDEAQCVISDFERSRSHPSAVVRLRTLIASGIHRQTVFGQLSLYGACALKRL
jgi:glycosyltransferase involved in cell wall biosynthesis